MLCSTVGYRKRNAIFKKTSEISNLTSPKQAPRIWFNFYSFNVSIQSLNIRNGVLMYEQMNIWMVEHIKERERKKIKWSRLHSPRRWTSVATSFVLVIQLQQHKHTDTEGTRATPLYAATIFILIVQLQHHKHTNTEGTRATPLQVHIKQLKTFISQFPGTGVTSFNNIYNTNFNY